MAKALSKHNKVQAVSMLFEDCRACEFGTGYQSIYGYVDATRKVKPSGNANARVFLIGEAPDISEAIKGKPFVGPSGKKLREAIQEVGFKPSTQCFMSSLIRCNPPFNRDPTEQEIQACLPNLEKELEIVQPKTVLILGNTALYGLTKMKGVTDKRGVYDDVEFCNQYGRAYLVATMVVTYHPSYVLRRLSFGDPHPEIEFLTDIHEAFNIAYGGKHASSSEI